MRFEYGVNTALIDKLIPFTRHYLTVLAYNSDYDGTASHTLEIFAPEGTPGPVSDFAAYPLGPNALLLTWAKPAQPNGILTGYSISYRRFDGNNSDVGEAKHLDPINDPEETRAKLSSLEPGTKYRLFIRARTVVGHGESIYIEKSTDPVGLRTRLDRPKFSYAHKRTENGSTALIVRWIPDPQKRNDRPGSQFYAKYKLTNQTEFQETQPVSLEKSILLQGLQPKMLYDVRVVAMNGDLSAESEIQLISIPLLEVQDKNSSSLPSLIETTTTTSSHELVQNVVDSSWTEWRNNMEKRFQSLLAKIPPVGFVYTQYSGELAPKSLWPNATWEDISTKHFRSRVTLTEQDEGLSLWKRIE